jgi:hypothetical protein
MTTYSTGNPLGSTDPRDLYDNAENLDNLVNGDQAAYNDRLGKSRRSWQSIEDEFAAFIAASGYQFAGDYAAGIEVTQYNQVVRDSSGEFWRVSGSTELPYTTTGAGLPEGGAFVAAGDAVLRQELGQGVRRVSNLQALKSVSGRFAGDVAYMTGRTTTGDGGEGEFLWDSSDLSAKVSSDPKSGLFVPPASDPTGASGAWVRSYSGYVNALWFGAKGDGAFDNTAILQGVIDSFKLLYLPSGEYRITSTLYTNSGGCILGDGKDSIIFGDAIASGPVLRVGAQSGFSTNNRIESISIRGANGCYLGMEARLCGEPFIDSVRFSGTFTHGALFDNCYPGTFRNIRTNGTNISGYCFKIGDEVNACHFDNIYTSNSCDANLYIDGNSHGTTFTNFTAQGGKIGVYYKDSVLVGTLTFNSLYTENVVKPVVLGNKDNPLAGGVKGVVFNGGSLSGPTNANPDKDLAGALFEIHNASGVVINSVGFVGTSTNHSSYPRVTISGSSTYPARATVTVNKAGEIVGCYVEHPGIGYTSATAEISSTSGSGATLTPVIEGGKIVDITVDTPGSGYSSAQCPMVAIIERGSVSINATGQTQEIFGQIKFNGNTSGVKIPLSDYDYHTSYPSNSGVAEAISSHGGKMIIRAFGYSDNEVVRIVTPPNYSIEDIDLNNIDL